MLCKHEVVGSIPSGSTIPVTVVVFRHLAVETSKTSFAALYWAGVLLIDIVNEGICLLAYAVRIERCAWHYVSRSA